MTAERTPEWSSFVQEWEGLVRKFRNDYDALWSEVETLVEKRGGFVENTGGGVMVGTIRLNARDYATVNDESIALWQSREPFSDDTGDEFIWAEDVQ